MSDLLKLAERVEAGSADDQHRMIEQAAAHLALHQLWPARGDDTALAAKFYAFLNVGAFESAAVLLVPEGLSFEMRSSGTGDAGQATVWDPMRIPGDREWRVYDCKAPALALAAAILRACDSGRSPKGGDRLRAPGEADQSGDGEASASPKPAPATPPL